MAGAWEVAVAQIEAADLPCPVYRTARRLLDRAAVRDGFISLSDADLRDICQSEAEGTLRSHLIQMQSAGILNYSRRQPRHGGGPRGEEAMIFIQFEAWSNLPLPLEMPTEEPVVKEMIAERSNLIAQRSFTDPTDAAKTEDVKKMIAGRSFTRAQRSKMIDQRSFLPSTSHARSGWLVGSLPSSSKRKKPTNQPQAAPDDPQQLALGLLIDPEVGIWREVAKILVDKLPAVDIYQAVDNFLADLREGKVRSPGLLKKRLETLQPSRRETIALSAGFRDSELFQRHRLPDELLAGESRRNYSEVSFPDDSARRRLYRR